jgi:Fe-S-cluster containining protein
MRMIGEERVEQRGDDEGRPLNPFWLAQDGEEHPAPELGCIRRGLCCRSNPGRFAPGEVEQAAAQLGLEPDAFVRRYLVVVAVEVDDEQVDCFAPVKLGVDGRPIIEPATRADRLYHQLPGPCVFYDGQGCRIYKARPLECQRYVCTQSAEEQLSLEEIGRLWKDGRAPD